MIKEKIQFKEIVAKASDIILVTKAKHLDHPGPEIIYVNDAFTRLTGYTPDEIIGKTPRILQGEETDRETLNEVKKALIKKEAVRFEVLNYSKSGDKYWLDCSIIPLLDEQGEVTQFAAIERDLTEYKSTQAQLRRLATIDPLTGLLNRRGFEKNIELFMSDYERHGIPFSIGMIDIDCFKNLNDIHGHDLGDASLELVAQGIRRILRQGDIAARFGGDEIVVALRNCNTELALRLFERILADLKQLQIIKGKQVKLSASAGVSEVLPIDRSFEAVIKRADELMYLAKNSGKDCVKS